MKDKEVKNSKGELHNINGPAYIEYFNNGIIKHKSFYINNNFHNENGPARISYYENGNISYEEYWINNKLHNINGPAYVSYFNNGNIYEEYYYINGKKTSIVLFKWHRQNNIPFNNLTSQQEILRKIQIGL